MAAELNDPLELDDAPSDQPTAASAKSSVDDNKVEPRVPGKSARWAIDCQDDDDEGFNAWGSSDWRALLGDGKANAEDGQNKIEADLADARQSVVDALAAKTEPPVEPKAAPAVSTAMWWVNTLGPIVGACLGFAAYQELFQGGARFIWEEETGAQGGA